MNSQLVDQLDETIALLLAGTTAPEGGDFQLLELTAIAADLRYLPRPAFRNRLQADLMTAASLRKVQLQTSVPNRTPVNPAVRKAASVSLSPRTTMERFLPSFAMLSAPPMKRSHLALSFALHVAALAGVFLSGVWVVRATGIQAQFVSLLHDTPLVLSPGSEPHGGGGGGDHDHVAASKGTAPRFAKEQLTPPAVVVQNEAPKLTGEPTVLGPPEYVLPSSALTGDPLANVVTAPSNGTGSGGGVGSGTGGGVGLGHGGGIGLGYGGGVGGGVYTVGGGVTAPRALYQPDPEYSEEARRAKFQGTVVLDVVIAADGRPRDLHIIRSLGMGLDEKAVDAVHQWKFAPATKDGHPVAVRVAIEVAFRLY